MDSLQVRIASILKCPLCHCAPVMPGSHFTTSSILAMDTPMPTTSLELPGRTRASQNMGMLGGMKIVALDACCICLFVNCKDTASYQHDVDSLLNQNQTKPPRVHPCAN